jgi:hypothetical protein
VIATRRRCFGVLDALIYLDLYWVYDWDLDGLMRGLVFDTNTLQSLYVLPRSSYTTHSNGTPLQWYIFVRLPLCGSIGRVLTDNRWRTKGLSDGFSGPCVLESPFIPFYSKLLANFHFTDV